MTVGFRDTSSLVMMTGWDSGALQAYQLQDGTTFASVVAEMNAALAAINAEIYNDPLWSSMVSYTDQLQLEYRVGASNGMEGHTEYGRPEPKRAATEGHMIPLAAFDRGLGWTWDYLRMARMDQITADIADAIKDVRDKWRVLVLTRCLKRTDDSGALIGLGSGGYSPGFATTAASTNVDFLPPAYGGTSFANTHEHYTATSASGSFTDAIILAGKLNLREHGHEPPYDLLIGLNSEAAIRALGATVFFPAASLAGVVYGNDTAIASGTGMSDSNGSYFIGVVEDCRVRVVRGIPQYYGFMYKSYGPNSQRNPLRVRLQKGEVRPRAYAMVDPRAGSGAYPLQYMMLFTELGVGVADRTDGVAFYNNSGSWTDGTPT